MKRTIPGLRTLRRLYATFFLLLFLLLLFAGDFRRMQGYDIPLFLELDPLVALSGFLTSVTVYKGMILSLAVVIPTLFLGRFFCSWVCPLGSLHHVTGLGLFKHRPSASHAANSYKPMFRWKYHLLIFFLIVSLLGGMQAGLLDPIALLFRSLTVAVLPMLDGLGFPIYPRTPVFQGGLLIATLFLLILAANRFMPRFWCRVLCPLGALLGILSRFAPLGIQRDVDLCSHCNRCLHHCQGGCDPHAAWRKSECHLCMNCIADCPEGALHYGLPKSRSSIHLQLDLNRRRLLETAAASLVMLPFMRRSLSSVTTDLPTIIRPPGSLAEEDFAKRCIKCAACMRICPTNALQPTLLEGGWEGIWTPILIPRVGYCEHHCVLCGRVCPTGAIRAIAVNEKIGQKPFDTPIRLGTAFFDRGRCLPWAMDIPCIVCEEVCPTSPKAIWYRLITISNRDGVSVTLKQPYLKPDLCIGCGICENKCPVGGEAAIRVSSIGESRSTTNRMLLKASP
ncbi:MAG: 4Fe-4S binding protein [Magnetococcales bacterium]|nr:4Fe-4S binding protein [Magnetococcales bacterium]